MIDDDAVERMAVGWNQTDFRFQPIVQVKSKRFESIGWELELSDGKSTIKSLVLNNKNKDLSFEELEIIKILKFLSKPGKSIYAIIIFQIERIFCPSSLFISPTVRNIAAIVPIEELSQSINWKILGKLVKKTNKKFNQGIEYFKCSFEDANKDSAKFYFCHELVNLYFNELIKGNFYWVTGGNLKKLQLNDDTNKKTFIIEATYQTEIKYCESSDFSIQNSNYSNFLCSNTFNNLPINSFEASNINASNINISNLNQIIKNSLLNHRIKTKAICTIDRIPKDCYSNLFYASCPKRGCNKKIKSREDKLFCMKCQEFKEISAYRYIVNLTLTDNTDSIDVIAFDRTAKELFGISADCFKFWLETRVSKIEEIIESLVGRQIVAEILPKSKRFLNQYELVSISSPESYPSTSHFNSSNQST